MNSLRVAAAVLNQTPLDWQGNLDRIRSAIDLARDDQVDLLCLPELCIPGYGCEDMFLSPGIWQTSWNRLRDVVASTEGMAVAIGLPIYHGNGVYNTACLAVDRQILGFAAKRHLAGDGLHYEPRWFRAWPSGTTGELHRDGQSFPVGDLAFDIGGVRIGFEICEDAWVANRPGSSLSARGVDIILNPSASHFAFGKHEIRKRFVLEGSRAFGVTYVYANLLGNESGRAIYDGGALIASSADLVAAGPRFGYSDVAVTAATVNLNLNRTARAKTFAMRNDLSQTGETSIVRSEFSWQSRQTLTPSRTLLGEVGNLAERRVVENATAPDVTSQEEEFTRAVALALFDYVRKSRSHGFVVSMSGGADSSAVACLIRMAVELAVQDLGIERVAEKLSHIPKVDQACDVPTLMQRLFLGVYQATRNSSETTLKAAKEVTERLDGEFMQLDVDPIVSLYRETIERAIGRQLDWKTDDIALQNIQARTRGPSVWMLANLRNALLLATSNRSEAAVGYATMDGDTCGGLSPVAGIDKAFLRDWLRWMETDGPAGLAPIPALQLVNCQQPTAELRPSDSGQTDEGDLMPYPLLDAIEAAAIRDKMLPQEVLLHMQQRFPEYDAESLRAWIKKFFRLWSRNQWKRERYAPSFHLDDANLDPKTWCRFPILSGGYAEELDAL